MKKLILLFMAVFAVINISFSALAAEVGAERKIIAYYFHTTFRCHACTIIERYSREAIEVNFKDAIESGALEFRSINVDQRGNEHFVKGYQLYTKSLVLSLVKDGREITWKNLDKIWLHARNKQRFFDYVTEEVSKLLAEAL